VEEAISAESVVFSPGPDSRGQKSPSTHGHPERVPAPYGPGPGHARLRLVAEDHEILSKGGLLLTTSVRIQRSPMPILNKNGPLDLRKKYNIHQGTHGAPRSPTLSSRCSRSATPWPLIRFAPRTPGRPGLSGMGHKGDGHSRCWSGLLAIRRTSTTALAPANRPLSVAHAARHLCPDPAPKPPQGGGPRSGTGRSVRGSPPAANSPVFPPAGPGLVWSQHSPKRQDPPSRRNTPADPGRVRWFAPTPAPGRAPIRQGGGVGVSPQPNPNPPQFRLPFPLPLPDIDSTPLKSLTRRSAHG